MIDCPHEPKISAVCPHLDGAREYCEWFTGRAAEHHLLCLACADAPETAATIPVCAACGPAALIGRAWNAERGVLGQPGLAERDGGLAFVHERVDLDRLAAPILDLRPAPGPTPVFLAFLGDGSLVRIDLQTATIDRLADLSSRTLHRARAVALAVAPLGDFVAIVNDEGGSGVVVALADGSETTSLTRGDFSPGDGFPIALTTHQERTVVIHATRWNRLDVSDAATGALLSARSYGMVEEGERPPHFLDFSHRRLVVAPTGDLVADCGEGENGLGRVATFSLDRMLGADPWESEDGERRREHCPRWYASDPPVAWLDDRHLAVWGYGPSGERLIDAVVVCDAETGGVARWFPGPRKGELVVHGPHLVVHSAEGTSVWDPASGERLLHDPGFAPQRFHPGAGAFLSTNATGDLFVLSRLVDRSVRGD
jgi:hypothetical protein